MLRTTTVAKPICKELSAVFHPGSLGDEGLGSVLYI